MVLPVLLGVGLAERAVPWESGVIKIGLEASTSFGGLAVEMSTGLAKNA